VVSAATQRRPTGPDPTVYPVDDDMPEGTLQRFLSEFLRALLVRLFAARGVGAFVGANQFIYWKQYTPTRRVAPDLYVLPGVDPNAEFGVWKVWETRLVPSFALEIVSLDVAKDYEQSPARYAELGVAELVVFDPGSSASPDRWRWQVFRPQAEQGFVLVERSNGDRVRSEILDCWLREVGHGNSRLRIGLGPRGEELLPSADEAERAERAAKEAERAAREKAELELAELRAEVERLRAGPQKK